MEWLARAGLAARGVMYVLVGALAVQIAFGQGGHHADRSGALRLVAQTPFGEAALWLLVVGFGGMTLWRLSEAAYGAAGPDGKKTSTRLAALGRAIFYGFVVYSILKYALGIGAPQSSNKQSHDLTAEAMKLPGGRVIVGLIGVAFFIGAVRLAYSAFKKKFLKKLDLGRMGPTARRVVERLGQFGGIARGTVFATVATFFIVAAIQFEPSKAKGLDSALRTFAHTPLGPWLLVLVAAGLVVFGVYSFCESRWRRVR
ncbi:MAG TPA: DUF1206 domain-containing protein [Streptosporangiaceae bacterium]